MRATLPLMLVGLFLLGLSLVFATPVIAQSNSQTANSSGETPKAEAPKLRPKVVIEPQTVWTFPNYIGNVGAQGLFMDMKEDNVLFGLYYKHFVNADGPLYVGFEIMPFAFGTVYDKREYPGLRCWSTRWRAMLRVYSDMLVPETYLEVGLGAQFLDFRTADDLAVIQENGYSRSSYGRWRVSYHVAIGAELGLLGLELGWDGFTWPFRMDYSIYSPNDPIHRSRITGMLYLSIMFRFNS